MRHSKNNTASGVFTYSERQMTGYGTKRKRLGVENKRQFDSCYLCLAPARQPVICREGHLSCKECALQCILDQKQQIRDASKRERDRQKIQQEKEQTERSKEINSKKLRLLEGEVGLKSSSSTQQLVKQHAAREESHFWTPSKTPTATASRRRPSKKCTKKAVECLASSPPHALRLKDLIEVCFSDSKLCPACDKPFGGSEIQVIVGCGHVVCGRCVGNFVEPVGLCFVCQKEARKRVVLVTEGTGFAAGGGRMVATSYDHALQA